MNSSGWQVAIPDYHQLLFSWFDQLKLLLASNEKEDHRLGISLDLKWLVELMLSENDDDNFEAVN